MQVVCPTCGHRNNVVDGYKPGAILACTCGEYLQFVAQHVVPLVVTHKTISPELREFPPSTTPDTLPKRSK
jgi:hypothetical protein